MPTIAAIFRNTSLRGMRQVTGPPTPPETTEPPTAFSAGNPTDSTISITWTASVTSGATTKIYRSVTSGSGFSLLATKSAGVQAHTDAGLDPETTYYYYAVAYTESGGDSTPTGEMNVTTLAEGAQTVVRFPEDFTYLGAFRIPRAGGGSETHYGKSLTLRHEPTDTGNTTHLMSTAYGGGANKFGIYEFRIPSPMIGVGYNPTQYPLATIVKNYIRTPYVDSEGVNHFATDYLDGSNGIRWDEASQKLLFCYQTGYSSDGQWGYATLDYSAGTGVAERWGFTLNNQGPKAINTGFLIVPDSFAEAYLNGENIIGGWGGYYSIIGSADCSMGPSLTVIPRDFIESSSGSSFTGVPLLGYWPVYSSPGIGRDRGNRPEYEEYGASEPSWGGSKWDWNDRVQACAFVYTPSKRGVLFFGSYGRGRTQYLQSTIKSMYYGHYCAVYDPIKFTPISGTPRYDIQPDEIRNCLLPVVDYSESRYEMPSPTYEVTSISSDSSKKKNSNDGCVVTCPGYGFTSSLVWIDGADREEYNGFWVRIPIDENSFYLRNTSDSANWSGVSSTNDGITATYFSDSVESVQGADFDHATGILYLMLSKNWATNNLSGHSLVMMYQMNDWEG